MEVFNKYCAHVLGMPLEEMNICMEGISQRHVDKNQYILRPGDMSPYTYFVEKGILRMYSVDKNGKEHIIQFAPEEWMVFDRRSTYMDEPAAYYIQAVEDSEVIYIKKGFMEDIIRMYPETAERNTFVLNRHILLMQQRIHLLLSATAEERYLGFMKMYPGFTLRVPQWMVASYLGITPESLSRVRRDIAMKMKKN